MLRQNSDLDLLRTLVLQVIDRIETQLEGLSQRIDRMEQREFDRTERLERLEGEVPYLRYRFGRSDELEYLENPYSLDGDARCNS